MSMGKRVSLGIGYANIGSRVTWLAPHFCGGGAKVQKMQAANVKEYGRGPFEVVKITLDKDDFRIHLRDEKSGREFKVLSVLLAEHH